MRDEIVKNLLKMQLYLNREPLVVFFEELENDHELLHNIERSVKDVDFFKTKKWPSVLSLGLYRIILYVICRTYSPSVFVETGVLHGLTTNFILAAMLKNTAGVLVSVDAPSYYESGPANNDGFNDTLPPGKEPGWVINDKYKQHWELHKGLSSHVLPEIYNQHETIDIFLHDSEHTYETMWNEYELSWSRLKDGGLLISDNIDTTTAFFDFCNYVSKSPLVFPKCGNELIIKDTIRFGLIKK